jgi:uncharacterized membrane protein (DUF485 family)
MPAARPSSPDWAAIEQRSDFKALLAAKRRFIVPATVFFLVYYMALPVLVGYFPELMKKPVWGPVNAAYAFALSQFAMTFLMAAVYVRKSREWDRMEHELLSTLDAPDAR